MKKPVDLNSLVSSYETLPDETFQKMQSFFGFSIKDEEVEQISSFINNLKLDNQFINYFFVGYTIPQIGKEFDLLRFGEKTILNIEVKRTQNGDDPHEQLIKNDYYLSFLDKEVEAFSYIEDEESLYYLEDKNTFRKVDFELIEDILVNQEIKHYSNIDDLFDPSEYLVSPFNDTRNFINDTYFLTQQQSEFKENILNNDSQLVILYGMPGTGKTLLLYDLAKNVMETDNVAIIHSGNLNSGHLTLIEDNGWNILAAKDFSQVEQINPDYIFVDETQRMFPRQLMLIMDYIKKKGIRGIFSIDPKQILSLRERKYNNIETLTSIKNSQVYNLSKKIRTNKELGTFIKGLFNLEVMPHFRNTDNVAIHYFNDRKSARSFSRGMSREGWQIIEYTPQNRNSSAIDKMKLFLGINAHNVVGQEFDKVLVVMGDTYYYDDNKRLREEHTNFYDIERMLYQSVTRARKQIMLLIVENPELMNDIMKNIKIK